MKDLSLKIPGVEGSPVEIQPPQGVPSGTTFSLGFLATRALEVVMVLGIFLALFYLLYGGIYWLQSSGEKEKLDKARRIIVYSIIGLVVMSLSMLAVNVIARAVGIETLISGIGKGPERR